MNRELVLAVDVGGTKMAAGLVDRAGTIVRRADTATPPGASADALWSALAALVKPFAGGDAVVCGVGCGGPMTPGGDRVSPLNIPGWRDFPLRARLAELSGLPVFVDNDAKALALGEGWIGAAVGVRDFIAMVVSTGVGGGIVLDGRLLDLSAAVWTGRKRRLMTKDEYVDIASSVQALKLAFHPLELLFVSSNIRVQSDHESIAVTKGECWITGKPARRPIGRDQGGNGIEIISQGGEAFWVVCGEGSAHIMISRHQEIRDTSLGREAVNQRHKTNIPLMRLLPF